MNFKHIPIRIAISAALAMMAPVGHGQEARFSTDTPAETEMASFQANSNSNQLVLTVKDLGPERMQGVGLIYDLRKDVTDVVRAALANNLMRVEPTIDGFTLDLGPSGGAGEKCIGDGVLSLTLSSGEVVSAPIKVAQPTERTELFPESCVEPELDQAVSDPVQRYAELQQEAVMDPDNSSVSPVMGFTLQGDHLVMTVAGAAWDEVQGISWSYFESQDRTEALGEALANGSARITPTADGFLLEIDDVDLLSVADSVATLTLDTGAVLSSPILPMSAVHR